jgi:hypothetical protein
MTKKSYEPLPGGNFGESFLLGVEQVAWPNNLVFVVWSPQDRACYRITAETVLEFHYLRTGTGPLTPKGTGIPLDNIYLTYEDAYEYWMRRIRAFTEQGYDSGEEVICLEFNSHLFANRKRDVMTRDKDTGVLVACRKIRVNADPKYQGPRPTPYNIPAAKND